MKQARNKVLAIIIPILVLLVCVCGYIYYLNKKPIVITLGVFSGSAWDVPDPYTYEFLDEAIAKFEAQNSGVKVEYVSGIQKEDYSEWLSGKMLSGEAPDVFMVLPEDFSTFQQVGGLKRLDGIIADDATFNPEDFYEGAYDFGTCNGMQFGIPLESAPDMMFVNKTLLKKESILVPSDEWTWEELYQICKRMTKDTDGNGVIDQFGIYNYTWKHAFVTNNVALFNDDGTLGDIQGTNAQEAIDFIKMLNDLNEGCVIKENDFDMGNVAFMPMTLAQYRAYKPYPWSIKKYSNFDWECITLPRGPQGGNHSIMNTMLLCMNSRTKHSKLAWELMKTFCCDEEIQLDTYKYREGGAVLKKTLNKEQALLNVNQSLPKNGSMNIGIIHTIMESGISDYNYVDIGVVSELITKEVDDIITNERNTKIALKHLQRKLNEKVNE